VAEEHSDFAACQQASRCLAKCEPELSVWHLARQLELELEEKLRQAGLVAVNDDKNGN
jgi:hypothetical protein